MTLCTMSITKPITCCREAWSKKEILIVKKISNQLHKKITFKENMGMRLHGGAPQPIKHWKTQTPSNEGIKCLKTTYVD